MTECDIGMKVFFREKSHAGHHCTPEVPWNDLLRRSVSVDANAQWPPATRIIPAAISPQ